MRHNIQTIILLCTLLLCASLASAVELPLQGTVLNSTNQSVATGNLRVYIYNSTGSEIYDSLWDFNDSIVNGSYSVVLGRDQVLNLVHGATYSLDLSVNEEDLDFNGNERQNFTSPVGTYTDTTYNADGIYIYNNGSDTFYLNETALNATIDARDTTLNLSGTGEWSIQIGIGANASQLSSLALGYNANSSGINGVAIGARTIAENTNAVAIGNGAEAHNVGSIAFAGTNISGANSVGFNFGLGIVDITRDFSFVAFGNIFNITNSSSNAELCLNNDCISAWPVGGAGSDDGTGGWTNNSENTSTNLNVGIGKSTGLQQKLNVYDALDSRIWIDSPGSAIVELGGGSTNDSIVSIKANDSAYVKFVDNNVDSEWEVGLGRPGLEDDLSFWDGVGSGIPSGTRMVLKQNGRVGIGLSNPSHTFSVNGSVNITNSTGDAEICLNDDCRSTWPASGAGSNDGTGSWTNDSTWTNTTLHVNVSGNISTSAVCINGDCRAAWPAGFTAKEANDAYLSNDSTTIYFNESALNNTIDARDTDTTLNLSGTGADSVQIGTGANASGLNSISIGLTSDATGYGSVALGLDTKSMDNHSLALGSFADASYRSIAIGMNTLASGNSSLAIGEDAQSAGLGSIAFTQTRVTGDYSAGFNLVNDSLKTINQNNAFVIYGNTFNLTNATSDAEICLNDDCRSAWPAGGSGDGTGGWTNNSENTTTSLNVNISGNLTGVGALFTWIGSSVQRISNLFVSDADVSGTLTVSGDIVLNGTSIDDWTDISGGSDTQKDTAGNYLYNDSTVIYFNESYLNATIDARDADNDTTYTADNNYLALVTTMFAFNETKLNATIDARATGVTGGWANDSNYTNTTKDVYVTGNVTADGLCLSGDTCIAAWPADTDTTAGWTNGTGTVITTYNVTIGDILSLTETTVAPGACATGGQIIMYNTGATTYPCFCNSTDWVRFDNYSVTC